MLTKEEMDELFLDIVDITIKPISDKAITSCCKSYLTTKGRCYTCPQDY
ncbi:hypothetical protein HYV86_03255 [Candidatus Woesearchaeota archaeon]|nr:hypothetical protein [Candidatus Woesearchaeota archaeon]